MKVLGSISSIMRPHYFKLMVLASLAGVTGLYFYAASLEPIYVEIEDIGRDDLGMTVSTAGLLANMRVRETLSFDLLDNDSGQSVEVFAPLSAYESLGFRSDFLPGAELRVVGQVTEYNGKMELNVRGSRDIVLVSKSRSPVLSMAAIARDPESFSGFNITIRGVVESVETYGDTSGNVDSHFTLRSGNRSIDCVSYGTDYRQYLGASITLEGRLEYDSSHMRWQMVSRRQDS